MHEPIQFGPRPGGPDAQNRDPDGDATSVPHPPLDPAVRPISIDLKRDEALTVVWSDGVTGVYPVALLRRHSPSAEAKALREQLAANPLTVLPDSAVSAGPLTAESAELVGRYALRLRFSDGHDTGLYTWPLLRGLPTGHPPASDAPPDTATPADA